MAKPEWGSKRICQNCAAKYYDLGRSPIVCPKCDTVFQPVTLLKSRRNRVPAAAKSIRPAPAKPDAAEIETKAVKTEPESKESKIADDSPDSTVEDNSKLDPAAADAAKIAVTTEKAKG